MDGTIQMNDNTLVFREEEEIRRGKACKYNKKIVFRIQYSLILYRIVYQNRTYIVNRSFIVRIWHKRSARM